MCPEMNAEDIARITAEVLRKLEGQSVDAGVLTEAVKSATGGQPEPPAAADGADAEPALAESTPDTPATSIPAAEAPADGRQRIILASFGLNRPGIVAAISAVLAENLCSIEDMTQRIMQEFYTLIMIVDIGACKADFATLSEKLKGVEEKLGVTILAQHEDVFRYMHRV